MATSIDIAQLQTLTIKQLKAQIAEATGQTVKSNNRPYLIGKLTKALAAKAAAEAAQARTAKKTKTTRKAKTAKAEKAEKSAKAEKAERRTRTSPRKAGERDPRLPAAGSVLGREHKGKKIRVTVLEDGFRYEGETYNSLSTIARRRHRHLRSRLYFARVRRRHRQCRGRRGMRRRQRKQHRRVSRCAKRYVPAGALR